MGKLLTLVVFALIGIGSLGWALGERQHSLEALQTSDVGFPSLNTAQGRTAIEPSMLAGWMQRSETYCLVVDMRSREDFEQRHVWRAVQRDYAQLISLRSMRRLPRHKPIVVYGDDGEQVQAAVELLRLAGLNAFSLAMTDQAWGALSITPTIDETAERIVDAAVESGADTDRRGLSTESQRAPKQDNEPALARPAERAMADNELTTADRARAMASLGFLGGN